MVARIAFAIVSIVVVAGVGSASAQDGSGGLASVGPAAAVATLRDLQPPPLPRGFADGGEHDRLRRELAGPARPGALTALYAGLVGLSALDAYSTMRAIGRGGRELNPVVAPSTGHAAALAAMKAASAAGSIYFAEKIWKKNRAAAIVTMAAINAGTAVVVARNFRNAR